MRLIASPSISSLTQRLQRALGVRPAALRVLETIASSVLVILLSLLTGVISARLLGPVGRGELASILLGLQIAGQLAVVGLPASVIYCLRQYPKQKSEIIGAVFILAAVSGIVTSLIFQLVIPPWLDDYQTPIVYAAQTTVLLAPFWAALQIATPVLRARDEFIIFNGVRILPPTLTLLCLSALAILHIQSPIAVAAPYSLSNCIFVFWPLWWIWRDCKPRIAGGGAQLGRLLRYGARSLAIDVANTMGRFLDRILLVYLLVPSAVGLYVVATSMAQPVKEIGLAIALVLFPKASGYEREEAIAVTGLATRVGMLVIIAVAVPLVIVAPMLLGLLFGRDFLPAVPVFRVILVATVFNGTADIAAQAFMATGRPGVVSILRCVELAILAVLLVYLVPKLGLMGAAWGMLAAACFRFIGIMSCHPIMLGQPPPRLYLDRSDIRRIRATRERAPAEPE
jgi:O-antigen/teichoic acid export membrane protein